MVFADRLEVDPKEPLELTYIDENGAEAPYALAYRPVGAPGRARTLSIDLAAPPEAILDAMRHLDPAKADGDARASLEDLARGGARSASTSRRVAGPAFCSDG
jgi:hypothetical protein